jgi:enoyl-CoA hydratase/carnithine racemase
MDQCPGQSGDRSPASPPRPVRPTIGGMTDSSLVLVELPADTGATDGIATVTMNNPGKRNALSRDMMRALIAAIQKVSEADAVRGIILAANGPVFSAGHDFSDMAGADLEFLRDLLGTCTELMTLVQQVPQPVLAKVHALATAAGCQLVASCDLAISADTSHFALPGGKGGLFCTTPLVAVARNVGRKRALELAMTGDPIDAATAADWGLINRSVPAESLDEACLDLMRRLTRGSAHGKAVGKAAFYAQVDMDQPHAYAHAVEVMAANAAGPDGQEGMAAFLAKRPPVWQNR